MNPPCSDGYRSMTSQYSWRLPPLLPIMCAYSHMISGRAGFVFAYASSMYGRAYIGA